MPPRARSAPVALLAAALALQAAPKAAREAEKELFAGRSDHAAELYTKLLHDNSAWAPGYYGLVRALIEAYRAPEAYAAAEEGLRRAPHKAETQTAAGMAAYRRGDLSKAEAYYRQAFKIKAKYAGASHGLALICSSESKFRTAHKLDLQAYHAAPHDPELLAAYAATLERAARLAVLERVLALYDPTNREARRLRAYIANGKAVGDRKLRGVTSPYQHYDIPLVPRMSGPGRIYEEGLRVRFNRSLTVFAEPLYLGAGHRPAGARVRHGAPVAAGANRKATAGVNAAKTPAINATTTIMLALRFWPSYTANSIEFRIPVMRIAHFQSCHAAALNADRHHDARDLYGRPCDAYFPSISSMSLKTQAQPGVRTYLWGCILHAHACRRCREQKSEV
jgi:hypothetical protein